MPQRDNRIMLSYPRILRKALQFVVVITLGDATAAYGLTIAGYPFAGLFGDIMLAEIAVLFVLAFLMDFAVSTKMKQFRKALQLSNENSTTTDKEAQQKAMLILTTGLILFLILVVLGIYLR